LVQEKKYPLDISQEPKTRKENVPKRPKSNIQARKTQKDDPPNRISGLDSNPILVFYNTDMKRTVCMQSDQ